MNYTIRKLLRNFSYSIGANISSLIISTLMILVVPKLIGVEEYGYWQLYTFYSSYIGFFHLGWCDGIYLRYGGEKFNRLNKNIFKSQFLIITILESIISIALMIILIVIYLNEKKKFVLYIVACSIVITISKTYLSYLLQATNKIKEYSIILLTEKISYAVMTIFLLTMGVKSFKPLVIADLVGKIFSLVIAIYFCKSIIFYKQKIKCGKNVLKEIKNNLNAGSKLMLANVSGMLILGVVRLAIENQWSITVFGKVSLSLSISNMLMVFITAIGIVIFPILKRSETSKINQLYDYIRNLLMPAIFLILLMYYPIQYILVKWLPQYAISLHYMALLFPICIFESKMSLLINTYLKAYRKENIMLKCNLCAVILSIVLTIINVYIFNNLELTIISIVIVFAFRCVLSELILSNIMKKNLVNDIILEILLCLLFMLTGWFINGLLGLSLYMICLLLYLYCKRNDLKEIKKKGKQLI